MSGKKKQTTPAAGKESTQVVQKTPGYRFEEGHPRFGGRKKNTAAAARAMAASMGRDPLEFMMRIINPDSIEQTVIEPDGTEKRVKIVISLDTRLDAAKTVVNYLYPRLSAQSVTGKDGGPVAVAPLDVTQILANPALADAAQQLALMVVDQEITEERAGLPAPDFRFQSPEYK